MIEDKINFVLFTDIDNNPCSINQVKTPHTVRDVQGILSWCDKTFTTWTEVQMYCDVFGLKLEELPYDEQFYRDMHQPYVKGWEIVTSF